MSETSSPAPTSADIARLAGVSRATVSYVLNDTAGVRVSEQTRQRVRAAADQLGYVPHAAARSLRAGHSGLVLLATPEVTFGPLFTEFFTELRAGLRSHGYTAVLYGNRADLSGREAARAWAELRPTAVVSGLADDLTPEGLEILRRSGTRAVLTLGPQQVPGVHALVLDQREMGVTAGAHLLARGHRAIGVIMPTDETLRLFSEPRLAGVRAAVGAEAGGAADGVRVEPLDLDYTEESAAALAARWRSLGLTALFCYNDEYAALVLAAFQDAGIAVPGEAALVGSDDLMLARVLRPRLTSVHVALPQGLVLADLIDRLIREPETPAETHRVGSARISVRDSG
ncbi:LacI family DNA-binding transcriptional regulator [Streptacidiphilus albus]|uniref:LacI family DNA-binding transcriptional regulator n=1 Tax=Streptacidiphilus albus TaxID=105425 RepID=UPI00054BE66E|nr:LacI family DNA-binding transcriptional regulator [Streptacidiphilus albus]